MQMIMDPVFNKVFRRPMQSVFPFSIERLFVGGEQGSWFDPADLSTLFQDAAGTTPVTAPGQPVGLMLDKSGNDLHATQSGTSPRPTYGVVPETGRRNLLRFTEQFDNTAWTQGGAITITPNAVAAPDGTMTAGLLNSPGFNQTIRQSFVATSTTHTVSAHIRAGSTAISEWLLLTAGFSAVNITSMSIISGPGAIGNNNSKARVSGLTSEWTRFSLTYSGLTVGNTYLFGSYVGQSAGGASLGNMYHWGAQLDVGSTATAYQRVTTQFDVAETGVTSLGYLFFGGAADPRWMVTPTITPGTDKVQVFAGVRKLSDAALGVVVESSVNSSSNAGIIYLLAPGTLPEYYVFRSGGSVRQNIAATDAGLAAPVTSVITGLGDISGDAVTIRADGKQSWQSTADQGTGDFLAHPIYIGAGVGASLFFNGHVYSLITRFGPNLAAQRIRQVERYVGEKTGVRL